MDTKQMLRRIDEIPGASGWWKRDCGKEFREAALKLQREGLIEEEIVELLSGLYDATADCYGD